MLMYIITTSGQPINAVSPLYTVIAKAFWSKEKAMQFLFSERDKRQETEGVVVTWDTQKYAMTFKYNNSYDVTFKIQAVPVED